MTEDIIASMTHPLLQFPDSCKWAGIYQMELGQVDYTHIGFEDHGMFTWCIGFDFWGSGQGTGHYQFNEESPELIKEVLKVIGVDTWEKLMSQSVYVLRSKTYGRIVGLANVKSPEFKWMFFPE